MPIYNAPVKDLKFLLHEVFDAAALSEYHGYEDATPDIIDAVLEEGARVCEEVFFPLNMSGDAAVLEYNSDDHSVTTPDGFPDAYNTYVEGGGTACRGIPNMAVRACRIP